MWLRVLVSVVVAVLCVAAGSLLGYWADDELWSYVLLGTGTIAGLTVLVVAGVRTHPGGLRLGVLIVLLVAVAILVLFVALLGDLYIECQDFDNCAFR